MVNVMKGGGSAPPPSPAWANFTLMMEWTPESSRYYFEYSVTGAQALEFRRKVSPPESRKPNGGTEVVLKPVCRDSLKIFHPQFSYLSSKAGLNLPLLEIMTTALVLLSSRPFLCLRHKHECCNRTAQKKPSYETGYTARLPAKLARRWGQMALNSDGRGKNILCCAD